MFFLALRHLDELHHESPLKISPKDQLNHLKTFVELSRLQEKIAMDISENNFRIVSQHLVNTLNPDVNIRRPGKLQKNVISLKCELQASCFSCFSIHSRAILGKS